MTEASNESLPLFTGDDAAREEIINRFEDAWSRGEQPTLDDYLPATVDNRLELLAELVHVDLEYRLKSGDVVSAQSYFDRFPELLVNDEVVVDLIAAEYRLRRAGGKL